MKRNVHVSARLLTHRERDAKKSICNTKSKQVLLGIVSSLDEDMEPLLGRGAMLPSTVTGTSAPSTWRPVPLRVSAAHSARLPEVVHFGPPKTDPDPEVVHYPKKLRDFVILHPGIRDHDMSCTSLEVSLVTVFVKVLHIGTPTLPCSPFLSSVVSQSKGP